MPSQSLTQIDSPFAARDRLYGQLPKLIKARALQRVRDAEAERWGSAEDSLDLQAEGIIDVETGLPFTKTAIRMCIGLMYNCSDETIRLREHVFETCPVELREKYPDLTFEYWRAMVGVEPKEGESKPAAIERIAQQIAPHIEAWGTPPSTATVRSWALEGEYVQHVWRMQTEGVITTLSKIIENQRTPVLLRGFFGFVRAVVQKFLDTGVLDWEGNPT